MRIQGLGGVSARFIVWNLSRGRGPSYVVVALDDGSLKEWGLTDCRIVEETAEAQGTPCKEHSCGRVCRQGIVGRYCGPDTCTITITE